MKKTLKSLLELPGKLRWQSELKAFLGRAGTSALPSSKAPRVTLITLSTPDSACRRVCREFLLENTRYPNWEWLVVDGHPARRDSGELVLLERWKQGRLLAENLVCEPQRERWKHTFAGLNNAAAALVSESDYYVFLNDDVFVLPGWLSSLVGAAESGGGRVGIAGSVLAFPFSRLSLPGGRRFSLDAAGCPGRIQHRGIRFHRSREFPELPSYWQPRNEGGGRLSELPPVPFPLAAVSAACMLVRTDVFQRLGGFDEQYEWGLEDVDLCLRMAAHPELRRSVVLVPASVAYHNESSTRRRQSEQWIDESRRENHRRFYHRWNAFLASKILAEKAGGEQAVFCSPSEARLRIALACTSLRTADGFGDSLAATRLAAELSKLGHKAILLPERPECRWYDPPEDTDVYLALVDKLEPGRLPRRGDIVLIGWVRNQLERWLSREGILDYNLLLGSSPYTARLLRGRVQSLAGKGRTPRVECLMLAADPELFAPARRGQPLREDLAFTGSYWNKQRDFEGLFSLELPFTFSIYGKRWELVPEASKYYRGFVPHERLPEVYRAARIILDDHHSETKPYGCINLRIFEAFACGKPVITNGCAGIEEVFQEGLFVYEKAEQIPALVQEVTRRLEEDPGLPARLGENILQHHTFAHRAGELCALVRDYVSP